MIIRLFNLFILLVHSCDVVVKRKNILDLSLKELDIFINATKALNNNNNGVNKYEEWAKLHVDNSKTAHSNPKFLPWHRIFIKNYENELQSINKDIVLPYWDWTLDSQAPEKSKILSDEYYGGDSDKNSGCLTNGRFRDWQVGYPNNHCLNRNYNGNNKIGSFYSPEAIESILRSSKSYLEFEQTLENGPHAVVHNGIGGEKGDFTQMYSPNDPLFYLHHTFIDRLWWEFQQRNPEMANNFENQKISINDYLSPFSIKVGATLSTEKDFCYTYDRYSANIPNGKLYKRDLLSGLLGTVTGVVNNLVGVTNILSVFDNLDINDIDLNKYSYDSFDRDHENVIRSPQPISQSYIERNGYDPQTVNNIHDQIVLFNAACNSLNSQN